MEVVKVETVEEVNPREVLVGKFLHLGKKLGLTPNTIGIIEKELTPAKEIVEEKKEVVQPAQPVQPAPVGCEVSPLQAALTQKVGY